MSDSVAMLLRRAGFGPTASELDAAKKAGYAATVAKLISPRGPDVAASLAPIPNLGPDPFIGSPMGQQRAAAVAKRRQQTSQIVRWWLDRMTVADHQATEKLVFFWHGHWATSIEKVSSPQQMMAQHMKFRDSPDFRVMARSLVTNPALIWWLDGQTNTKKAPNENLARELMELFMLGIGHYTEQDVKEAGRALTGWKLETRYPDAGVFLPQYHDTGKKTILGTTANFDALGLVDFLAKRPQCARFIASRLWFRYASSTEPIPRSTLDKMASAYPSTTSMLRTLFLDAEFRSGRYQLVKQPVEWLVGAMRQLRMRPTRLPEASTQRLLGGLESLGQVLFSPPSVGGWPSGVAWLTSSAAQVRLTMAQVIAEAAQPHRMTVEELANLLAVETWTDRTYSALKQASAPQHLLALGLVSPEYLVS
ncbi:uncharacterized protein (DUF1800 family) [Micromonospora pisi]|uniref:Uncharacterized protein (DUF1800 family) n=1 Tax=Micromonospora pisi TaxID=589240 RepID=A0A495JJM4_9ACTN|nr:DUF1800 domain-containing protein [Micromonospora pisi]RKR89260.1 uncharacterized protein (DUF1800 family) [Micromonospora pisi]